MVQVSKAFKATHCHNGNTLGLDVLCQWRSHFGCFVNALLHVRCCLVNSLVNRRRHLFIELHKQTPGTSVAEYGVASVSACPGDSTDMIMEVQFHPRPHLAAGMAVHKTRSYSDKPSWAQLGSAETVANSATHLAESSYSAVRCRLTCLQGFSSCLQ